MDKIRKLLNKISKKDREKLEELLVQLMSGAKKLKIIKIKNTDFYRVRHGNFRIIFHKEKKVVIIDSIRMRNERTYRKYKF